MGLHLDIETIRNTMLGSINELDLIKEMEGNPEQTNYNEIRNQLNEGILNVQQLLSEAIYVLDERVNTEYKKLIGEGEMMSHPENKTAAFLETIAKYAHLLDTLGTTDARQAAEGLDAIIGKYAEEQRFPAGKLIQDFGQLAEAVKLLQETRKDAVETLAQVSTLTPAYRNELEKILSAVDYQLSQVLAPTITELPTDMDRFIEKNTIHQEYSGSALKTPDLSQPNIGKISPKDQGSWNTQFDHPDSAAHSENTQLDSNPDDVFSASKANIVVDLLKIADLFDQEGLLGAANILETIVAQAYPMTPTENKKVPRDELYHGETQNPVYNTVRQEVAENRKQHHLKTMREEAPSQTRYSPELPGVPLIRVQDGIYQDALTRKIYDFKNGWTGSDGTKHPGGSIANQTPNLSQYTAPTRIFDSRFGLSKRRSRG